MKFMKAISPGKCILFGEHAVVYGYPAIAMSLNIYSSCRIKKIPKDIFILRLSNYQKKLQFSSQKEIKNQFPHKFRNFQVGLITLLNQYNIKLQGIEVEIASDLFMGGGLGSSASTAVSLIAALGSFYNLGLNKGQISEIAYKMEKIIHGTPSGIDNTICTYGNILIYQKKKFEILKNIPPMKVLISYTNIDHSTKAAIQKIAKLRRSSKKYIDDIFHSIGKITKKAQKAIISGNIKKVGDLMNKNQQLLANLGVSNKTIESINEISLENGLYGSKLTGAGLGGCVIGIGKMNNLKKASKILSQKGFKNYITSINQKGVHIVN